MTKAISDAIKDILIKDSMVFIPIEKISDDDGLQSVFGLDSLSFAELRYQCESRFNVEIDDKYFTPEYFNNIKNLTALISKLQSEKINHKVDETV